MEEDVGEGRKNDLSLSIIQGDVSCLGPDDYGGSVRVIGECVYVKNADEQTVCEVEAIWVKDAGGI